MLKVKIDGIEEEVWVKSWSAYAPSATPHDQTVTIPVQTGENVDGQYFNLYTPGDDIKYYVWYNVTDSAEVSTLLCVADVSGSLGGKYFTLSSPNADYYAWMSNGEKEDNDLICGAATNLEDSGGTADYFTFSTGITDTVDYVAWFNCTGGSGAVVPDLGSSVEYIEVNCANNATNTVVAQALKDAIDVIISDAIVSISTATVSVINDEYGVGSIATLVGAPTGFSVSQENAGVNDNTEPTVAGTAIKINFPEDSVNTAVGTAVKDALDALDDFGASLSTATVTITNADTGLATDVAEADSGFTATKTAEGFDDLPATRDPQVPYCVGVPVTLKTDDVNTVIATKTASAINGLAEFTCTASTNTLPIEAVGNGEMTTASQGTTNFTVVVDVIGSLGALPSGTWIKIIGKTKDDTPYGGVVQPDKFTPFEKIVLQEKIVAITETNN